MKTTGVAAALAVVLIVSSGRAQPQSQPMSLAAPPPPPDSPPGMSTPTRTTAVNESSPFRVFVPSDVRDDPSPGTRRVLEGLGGLGGGLSLGTLGVLMAIATQPESRGSSLGDALSDSFAQVMRITMFAGIGQIIGQPLGVFLVGRARGGNGGLGWAVLGTLLGNAAGSLGLMIPASACSGISRDFICPVGTAIGIGIFAFLSVGGTVLGYELSNDQRRLSPPPRAHASWSPSIVPTQGGLSFGFRLTL